MPLGENQLDSYAIRLAMQVNSYSETILFASAIRVCEFDTLRHLDWLGSSSDSPENERGAAGDG